MVGFSNLWIHLILKKFHWLSISKVPIRPFQMGSWARSLGGCTFCFSRVNFIFCILCSIFSQIYFGIVCIWLLYHKFDKKIWFTVIFFLSKRATFCSKYEFSFLNCYIFVPVPVIIEKITKMYCNYIDGKLWSGHLSGFINSILICSSP